MMRLSSPAGNVWLWLLGVCFSVYLGNSRAETISVARIENGVASNSNATLTFVWPAAQAKATLIMIPGGEGQIGLTLDKKDLGSFYGKALKPLSNAEITSGLFNVVIFDSPRLLPVGTTYPNSRATHEHLADIDSVVRFYQEKFNQPVWLMGHSNGAVSITEYYKWLQKKKEDRRISGLIYSSGRNGASFGSTTQVPVLFLAHEKDGCSKSTNANSRSVFNELKKYNEQKVDYVLLKTGDAEASEPCRSGYHMFFNAYEEAYKAIDAFAAELLK